MSTALKITKIGNSAGVILPRDLLAHLDAAVGETLSVVTAPGNSGDSILNSPRSPALPLLLLATSRCPRAGPVRPSKPWCGRSLR